MGLIYPYRPCGLYKKPLAAIPDEHRRQLPDAPWFILVGCIGQSLDSTFIIGKAREMQAPRSGRLFCFANDVPEYYFNNFGGIELQAERIA